jgi:NAD(P)-dependent dehydrogenase (short-subunit alcohol dehydrogenase family)
MTQTTYWHHKKVVITGGTSGLGKALALQLLAQGAQVAIIARTAAPLKTLAQEYPALIALQGDVSVKEQIHPLAGEIHARLGDVDILIHAASTLGATPLRPLLDTDCEDLEQVLQTNLIGPFRLTKALLPTMVLRQQGLVITISSDAAVSAYPTWGSYSVSKAALDHLSRVWDAELAPQGVRFLALDPGDMATPMHFAAIPDADPSQLRDPADSATRILELVAAEDFSHVRRGV